MRSNVRDRFKVLNLNCHLPQIKYGVADRRKKTRSVIQSNYYLYVRIRTYVRTFYVTKPNFHFLISSLVFVGRKTKTKKKTTKKMETKT